MAYDAESTSFRKPDYRWLSHRFLEVLRTSGEYTQSPGSNPLALRRCGLEVTWTDDFDMPVLGEVAHFLVSGADAVGVEGNLGTDGAGNDRANTSPCP